MSTDPIGVVGLKFRASKTLADAWTSWTLGSFHRSDILSVIWLSLVIKICVPASGAKSSQEISYPCSNNTGKQSFTKFQYYVCCTGIWTFNRVNSHLTCNSQFKCLTSSHTRAVVLVQVVERWRCVPTIQVLFGWAPGFLLFLSVLVAHPWSGSLWKCKAWWFSKQKIGIAVAAWGEASLICK